MHSLCFRDFDNSYLKDFSKRNSSRPPGVLLSWFFDFCKVPSTLSRISNLCTPYTISLCKVRILADDCACLTPVSFHSLQRESFVLSLLSFIIETNLINTLFAFCVHTFHHFNRRETIEPYTNIHSFIYS
jgi:hypothetical protein